MFLVSSVCSNEICSLLSADSSCHSNSISAASSVRRGVCVYVYESCLHSIVCVFSQMMEQLTDHHYDMLTVPEDAAASCVYVQSPSKVDFLLHRPVDECPDSIAVSKTLSQVSHLRVSARVGAKHVD